MGKKKDIPKVSVAELSPTAEKVGWLTKQGGSVKSWKRRFCCLDKKEIYYFASDTALIPKGVVDLSDRQTQAKTAPSDKFYFTVHTPGRLFRMYTDTAAEMQKWVNAINASVTCNPSPIRTGTPVSRTTTPVSKETPVRTTTPVISDTLEPRSTTPPTSPKFRQKSLFPSSNVIFDVTKHNRAEKLAVTSESICRMDLNNLCIGVWPFTKIKRYGHSSSFITFENLDGEQYTVETLQGEQITKIVASRIDEFRSQGASLGLPQGPTPMKEKTSCGSSSLSSLGSSQEDMLLTAPIPTYGEFMETVELCGLDKSHGLAFQAAIQLHAQEHPPARYIHIAETLRKNYSREVLVISGQESGRYFWGASFITQYCVVRRTVLVQGQPMSASYTMILM